MSNVDLSVNIGPLQLRNPIMLASGTVGYGNEISEFSDLNKLGAIVTKSLSLKPRKGNPPQRIVETPAGMLNAIGLANVGVEEFIKEKIPFLKQFDVPLICNIAASTIEEYVECTKILTNEDTIKAFEINVSCPNVREGGLQFGNDVKAVLSGPAIKPIALAKVLEISRNVDIPVIGIGGIMNWKDVIEFMIAGASAVQIGTLNFIDPAASERIVKEIEDYCLQTGVEKISELTAS